MFSCPFSVRKTSFLTPAPCGWLALNFCVAWLYHDNRLLALYVKPTRTGHNRTCTGVKKSASLQANRLQPVPQSHREEAEQIIESFLSLPFPLQVSPWKLPVQGCKDALALANALFGKGDNQLGGELRRITSKPRAAQSTPLSPLPHLCSVASPSQS